MAKLSFPSDTIALKVSTGGNSAGNGGDGVNCGNISSKPSLSFNPTTRLMEPTWTSRPAIS